MGYMFSKDVKILFMILWITPISHNALQLRRGPQKKNEE